MGNDWPKKEETKSAMVVKCGLLSEESTIKTTFSGAESAGHTK
jgi:hypothetical protein